MRGIFDAITRDLVGPAHVFGQLGLVTNARLTADHHAVGGGKGLACHRGLGFFSEEDIQNRDGNTGAEDILTHERRALDALDQIRENL